MNVNGELAPVNITPEISEPLSSHEDSHSVKAKHRKLQFRCLSLNFLPLVVSTLAALVLATCVILFNMNDEPSGGLTWPFFSQTGALGSAYYVFAIGNTIVGAGIASVYILNFRYQKVIMSRGILDGRVSRSVTIMVRVTLLSGTISGFFLAILSIFDTYRYPSIHSISAWIFFGLEIVATSTNTFVSYQIHRMSCMSEDAMLRCSKEGKRRTFMTQVYILVTFWIAFFLYLPMGYIVGCSQVITVFGCEAEGIGTKEFCESMRLEPGSSDTKLVSYRGCLPETQLRAVAQLVCVLCLIGYSLSFYWHDFTSIQTADLTDENDTSPNSASESAHAYNNDVV